MTRGPVGGAPGLLAGRRPPEVVVVGSASRDLVADDRRGWRLGGGVSYAALASARLGVRTAAVIGLDPQARDAHELELLTRAGVALLRVPLAHGPVFRNVEANGRRRQDCLDPGSPLAPVALPPGWADAAAWILAPVAAELPDAWLEVIGVDAFMALGWQGLLRTLRAGGSVTRRRPQSGRLVARANLVALSQRDLVPGTRPGDLAPFLKPGAWLVVTAGAGGGVYGRATAGGLGAMGRYPAFAVAGEVDATGAGDTFLAALVASLVHSAGPSTRSGGAGGGAGDGAGDPWRVPDVAFAAAVASFTVEGPGLAAVPNLAAVRRRLAGAPGQSFAEPPSSST